MPQPTPNPLKLKTFLTRVIRRLIGVDKGVCQRFIISIFWLL